MESRHGVLRRLFNKLTRYDCKAKVDLEEYLEGITANARNRHVDAQYRQTFRVVGFNVCHHVSVLYL